MSRFFKSAAFPILIVIVLAFFASKLISDSGESTKPQFAQFVQQIEQGKVQAVVLRAKDNSIDVTLKGGQKYTTAVPHNYEPIVTNKLLKAHEAQQISSFDVKPARSSLLLSL